MRALVLSFLLATFALSADAAPDDTAGPEILVSIKPVYSIVADVMLGSGRQVNVLLRGAASPHTYVLEPSDVAEIANADVIFWVGPAMEKFLVAPLASLNPKMRSVALTDADGIRLLPVRTGGLWQTDVEPDGSGGTDGHIWLDPDNAVAIARTAARVLGEVDPKYARLYAGNAESFAARMMLFDARLGEQLEPVRGRPYIVFHDGYHYFEAHYGLTPVGAVSVASERPLDTRRIEEIRALIKTTGATCILSTREHSPSLISALTDGTQVRTAAIEALGANIPSGTTLYQTLLARMATTLVSCLGG